ncbi:MAG: hypothetical protein JWR07_4816 [Nevskia sp.]|nr:hypothetical protein [Nevskia sp.]
MTAARSVIVWGGSGHARVLSELLAGLHMRIVAIFDNADIESPFPDVPLYIGREGFRHWRDQCGDKVGGLVAIGGSRGRERLELQELFMANDVEPVTVVHPRAFVAGSAKLGRGTQILAQASVAVDVSMGDACIVNHTANVDHECKLGHGVHVAPGAVLAGCVYVGSYTLIGAGAVILPRIRIGAGAIVGAGAVVTRNVPDGAVVIGAPARAVHQSGVLP